jgi:uncharacterized protein YjlB
LKLFAKHNKFINQMRQSQALYQRRRWFDAWREKFLNKNHYNYLCHIQRSLTKKRRSSSVTFNVGRNAGEDEKKNNNSGKEAASPVERENRPPVVSSKSPSPMKSGAFRRSQ